MSYQHNAERLGIVNFDPMPSAQAQAVLPFGLRAWPHDTAHA